MTEADVNKDIIAGRIEAFEFAATQFETYASDNDELNRRYRTKGKALEIANKRSQTFRDAAEDCRHYAKLAKFELEKLNNETR
jgi:hypothetical protein